MFELVTEKANQRLDKNLTKTGQRFLGNHFLTKERDDDDDDDDDDAKVLRSLTKNSKLRGDWVRLIPR